MVHFVATSQSADCIEAAIDAFADSPEDLSIHKLFKDRDNGQVGVGISWPSLLRPCVK